MGLINTYFLAADDDAASSAAAEVGGPPGVAGEGGTEVEQDQLLAAIRGTSYAEVTAEGSIRYVGEPGEQWLSEVRPALVTALAGLSDADVERVAPLWAACEEFELSGGIDPEFTAGLIAELAGLARTAASSGARMYCWGSV